MFSAQMELGERIRLGEDSFSELVPTIYGVVVEQRV